MSIEEDTRKTKIWRVIIALTPLWHYISPHLKATPAQWITVIYFKETTRPSWPHHACPQRPGSSDARDYRYCKPIN